MALGKQAKILTKQQQNAVLLFLETTRHEERNKVIFLLSVKAGLRAKEIANLSWGMVTDSEGAIAEAISIVDKASKGKSGGKIWMNKDLQQALLKLQEVSKDNSELSHIIQTERSSHTSAQAIVNTFASWYRHLGFVGCSSHSGRRTFITHIAKKISSVGGSMRDVQMLARHSSLNMTQRYIEADAEAMRKVVDVL